MRRGMVIFLFAAATAHASPLEEARNLIEQNRFGQARGILEGLLSDPLVQPETLVLLTRVCNAQADFEMGIDHGKQAVELMPDSAEAYFQYAVALRTKMQRVNKMRALFILNNYKEALRKALELDPNHLEGREEEIGFLLQAPGLAGGDKEKAKQQIRDLKAIDARRGLLFESDILRDEGEFEESIRILESLLENEPDDHPVRQRLAFNLQGEGRYREAIRQFVQLREAAEPRYRLTAQYQLARSRILGKFEPEQAVELLLDYLKNDPEDLAGLPSKSYALWRLGNSYEQLGRTDAAERAYREALDLDPDNRSARESLKSLLN